MGNPGEHKSTKKVKRMSNLAVLRELERTLNINYNKNHQIKTSEHLPHNCIRRGDHERLQIKY